MELVRLRANSQNRPCVDQPPYFSWVIVSEGQNVMQETYRIRVWSDRGEAWDSGVVKSDQSASGSVGPLSPSDEKSKKR